MTNLEIDRKLAEAMGYNTRTVHGICNVNYDPDDPNLYPWSPTRNIRYAWDVAERFGLTDLMALPGQRWDAGGMKWNG